MDLLNTSRFRMNLLTQVCVLMFVSLCALNTAQSANTTLACFGTTVCIGMTLRCNDQQIIRLVNQQYYYVKNEGKRCTKYGENKCNMYSPENCTTPVTKLQTLKLFETCSGKQETCLLKAQQGPTQGCMIRNNAAIFDSNLVTYDCDNDTDTVQLCSNTSRTSNSINVIFNGASTMTSYTTSQTCSCSISSSPTYHAYLQDFRPFRPNNTYECSSTTLNGYGKMCNGSKEDDFIYQSQIKLNITNHTITATNLFSQGSDDRPTMVWIRITSNESDPLTVTCTGITSLPNGGTTQAATSDTSDGTGVPSAAIVVPIVLVLLVLAAGVGIWYWRRKRQGSNENEQNSKDNKTYGQKNGSLISPGKISMSRLPDNYIDFDGDQGDEYSTIDKTKVKLSLPNVKVTNDGGDDNYCYAMPADAIRADDTDYNVVNLKSKPVVLDPNYSHLPGTKGDEEDEYSHINGPSSPARPAPVISDSSADVYSHMHCSTNTTAQNPSDGANVYSHLKGEKAIERTHQDVEDNTYDHTNSSREGNQRKTTASSMTTPSSSTYSHVTMPSSEKQPEDNGAESHEYFVLEKVPSREESV